MRLYTIFILFMLLLFSSPVLAAASSADGFSGVVVVKDGGKINWGNGYITASSEVMLMQDSIDPVRSRALAIRQGGVEARKKLLDKVLGLSLEGRKSVGRTFRDDIKVMNSLRGFIQNSLLSTAMLESGAIEVTASMSLYEGLADIIIPPTIPFLSGIAPTLNTRKNMDESEVLLDMPAKDDVFDGGEDALKQEVIERAAAVNSGVIIDARGLGLRPALLPIVYDGDGVGVYGSFVVSREAVLKHGLAAYMTKGSTETVRSRVGNFPLTVKAAAVQGGGSNNIIISSENAEKVRAVLKRKSVFENCAVVILTDNSGLVKKAQIDKAPEELAPSTDSAAGVIQEDTLDDSVATPVLQ